MSPIPYLNKTLDLLIEIITSCHKGYSLEQQKALFDNIKPLFANKPLLIVANKSDIWRDNLSEDKKAILEDMRKEVESETILEMSNKDDEDSVMNVKVKACEMLLQHRVEQKFKSKKVCILF